MDSHGSELIQTIIPSCDKCSSFYHMKINLKSFLCPMVLVVVHLLTGDNIMPRNYL